jgi:hypothetical protein
MARYTTKNGSKGFSTLMQGSRPRRGLIWGAMMIGALLAFEIFNFSTTEFALHDLLGELSFVGFKWSTILAIAFCGIDFAGIARIFTPEEGADEPTEVWYLFGAWLLAATMNAMLTWWGVSIAILEHETLGNAVVDRTTLLKAVPIFVAAMVWLSRVLIIGTFSVAGDRLFSQADRRPVQFGRQKASQMAVSEPVKARSYGRSKGSQPSSNRFNQKPAFRPAPKPPAQEISSYATTESPGYSRPEPTYHPVGMRGNNRSNGTAFQRK